MRGLEAEFERFCKICLEGAPPDQIESERYVFFGGALTATNRMLSILESSLPVPRKLALLRRCAREAQIFKQEIMKAKEGAP